MTCGFWESLILYRNQAEGLVLFQAVIYTIYKGNYHIPSNSLPRPLVAELVLSNMLIFKTS